MPKKKVEEETVPVMGDGQPARDENTVSYVAPADAPFNQPTSVWEPPGPAIYAAMSRVMQDIGAVGKNQKNEQQGYRFRGIDAIYQAAQLVLAKHGVVCVPKVLSTEWAELQSRSGGTMRHLKALIQYTFYAADGSSVEAVTLGEAMDSGDKSAYKAMSGASKYALLQTFMIPTDEPKDPEVESPETVATPAAVVGRQASGPVIEPVTKEETDLYLSIIDKAEAQLNLTQLRADLMKRFGGVKENIPVEIRDAWAAKNKTLAASGGAKP